MLLSLRTCTYIYTSVNAVYVLAKRSILGNWNSRINYVRNFISKCGTNRLSLALLSFSCSCCVLLVQVLGFCITQKSASTSHHFGGGVLWVRASVTQVWDLGTVWSRGSLLRIWTHSREVSLERLWIIYLCQGSGDSQRPVERIKKVWQLERKSVQWEYVCIWNKIKCSFVQ